MTRRKSFFLKTFGAFHDGKLLCPQLLEKKIDNFIYLSRRNVWGSNAAWDELLSFITFTLLGYFSFCFDVARQTRMKRTVCSIAMLYFYYSINFLRIKTFPPLFLHFSSLAARSTFDLLFYKFSFHTVTDFPPLILECNPIMLKFTQKISAIDKGATESREICTETDSHWDVSCDFRSHELSTGSRKMRAENSLTGNCFSSNHFQSCKEDVLLNFLEACLLFTIILMWN